MGIEKWKSIKGYEGKYKISSNGRIKSLNYKRTKEEKLMIPHKDKDGYLIILLSKNGKTQCKKIHRLVAETFIKNPNNYQQVNHKDENKQNNKMKNLEWCTQKQNNLYGSRIKKIKKRIYCIELRKSYSSITEAAEILKINKSDICQCCKNKLKTAGGYHWKYEKEII